MEVLMSVSNSSAFQAISILAVILSGIAIYSTQQPPATMDPVPTTESNNTAQLEEAIASLRGELITLQFRLDAVEQAGVEESAARELPGSMQRPSESSCRHWKQSELPQQWKR